jgi:hypothetical protein
MSKRSPSTAIPVPEPTRPLRRRTELVVGGVLLAIVVVGAVVASGQLEVPGSTHLSPVRVALFAVLGGVLSVVLVMRRGSQLRRR